MKAMVITKICPLDQNSKPLTLMELSRPKPNQGEVLIKVRVCGICHTELDEIEGRTPPKYLPMIPGHQVVGEVVEVGSTDSSLKVGDRIGVAWIYTACGTCNYCRSDQENLCEKFLATGRDAPGGYAQFMKAQEDYVYGIPTALSDLEAAPLLCAGAIGYRALRLTGLQNGQSLGLTGFGASAHLVLKMAGYKFPDTRVFVFARNEGERQFARELGAAWAGDTHENPPEEIDAIIDTTPAWRPLVEALKCLKPGGRLVINAIRKETQDQQTLLKLNYSRHLWMEKEIKSVANITRADVSQFLDLAARIPIKPHVQEYTLQNANQALLDLKYQPVKGAKVIRISG